MFKLICGYWDRACLRANIGFSWIVKFVSRAFGSLFVGAAGLVILVALGVIIGRIGYGLDLEWPIELGQMLIAIAGMISVLVMGVFYLKGLLATSVLVALDGLVERVSLGHIKNLFTKESGKDFRHDILGAFAWVTVFCVYCLVVPVWKQLTAVPVGAILAFFFAFASSKSWTFVTRPIGKLVVFSLMILVFVFHVLNVCTAGAMSRWVSHKGDLFAARIHTAIEFDDGREEIFQERASYERERASILKGEYRELKNRQLLLLRTNRENSVEFKDNASRMRALEGRTKRASRRVREVSYGAPSTSLGTSPVAATHEVNAIPSVNSDKFASFWSSNWGYLILSGLVVFLLILFVVGVSTHKNWITAISVVGLVVIGFSGVTYWVLADASLPQRRSGAPLQVVGQQTGPVTNGQAPPLPQVGVPRATSPGTAAPATTPARSRPGIWERLNSVSPERPGERR